MKKKYLEKIEILEQSKDELTDVIIKQNNTITELKKNNEKLNLDYMVLLTKYNEALKTLLKEDTKNISYNGKIYSITEINHYKKEGEVENVIISANEVPKSKGLVNSMADVFKDAYDNINKTLFGDGINE
ncbi:hypothetical protein [uncultured Megamonas sp.]|uniref:hypothetical protein n=1 Tax=uncultured Megamonas sp. TaxID=286140 RepID=UPI00259B8B0E|nr:hypothetical protein [uncultured Megamonas sp.]